MPKLIGSGIVLVCAFILFLMTYYTVAPYERAVLTRFGELIAVEGEGLHLKMPFVHSVTYVRTDIQNITPKLAANTYTIDNQEVDVVFNLFYRVSPDQVEFIFRNVQDYKERLESMAVDRLKAEMGKVNVAHVAEKRGELRDRIKAIITRDAASLGVAVTDFQLTNLEYTKSFKIAVEQAATAKAGVETRDQELNQARKTAERAAVEAKGRADAIRAEATGQADANLLVAEATAKAIRLKGEAEAAAIEAQVKALAQNAQLVELRKSERWDGKLPATMLSNVVPFMGVDQTGVKR